MRPNNLEWQVPVIEYASLDAFVWQLFLKEIQDELVKLSCEKKLDDIILEAYALDKAELSKLNETVASNRNNLLSPDIDRMRELKCKLDENGFKSYLFYSAQNDNMNCGQLITECTIGNY